MGMPILGPPIGVPSSPAFKPIPTTQPSTTQAPSTWSAPSGIRQPGTAFAFDRIRGMSMAKPYEPPAWATQILMPTTDRTGAATRATQQAAGARPGIPSRVNVNPLADDPLASFFGGDAGVAMGMVPGQQRGGAYHGIATAPVTMANFSTWGREGLVAALTSVMGKDYQQPENAQFGDQPPGPGDGSLEDGIVSGVNAVGDLVWKAFDAPLQWYRNSNAFNRGKSIRELALTGKADGFIIEQVTSAIFGGQERFSMDALVAEASRNGLDVIDVIAKKYDVSPDQVAAIFNNPFMSDEALGQITDGTPLSVDMTSNLLLEGGLQLALLAGGGVGLAKGGAMLGKLGAEAAGFGAGLRGAQAAAGADRAVTAARTAGMLTRKAMQINSWNTAAGWTVRGAEWGIKQYAVIAGDEELVKAMDRLLWQMPFSMNPGWNLIDGFSSHPIDAMRNLRRGQVAIGRRGGPGYVGQLDIKGLALRDGGTGETMTVRLAGKEIRLGADSHEFKVLGTLRDLTPDDLHGQFFARLGWTRENMDRVFGEGNAYDLTWDDARNALFHVSLQAVREGKGNIGRMEGLELPTMEARTAAFVRDNAKGALKTLTDNLTGKSDSMLTLFKSDFWDLAARNDSRMAPIKASLGAWDPDMAFLDFTSWIRASKIIRSAMDRGVAGRNATAAYRSTVNRAYVGAWLDDLTSTYAPDAVVPLSMVNRLKRFGGAVETRGKGAQLQRGRQAQYTRRQLEEIVADILASDDEVARTANLGPREQAAAYRQGYDPGQDPLEDARIAGIGGATLDAIRKAQALTPDKLTTPPPPRLVAHIAALLGVTADSILAKPPAEAWATVFDWLDGTLGQAAETGRIRDLLNRGAQTFRGRVSDGRMSSTVAEPMIRGIQRLRDELLTPLDKKLASRRPGLYERWSETAGEAAMLAEEIGRHLDAPEHLWRSVDVVPGVPFVLPQGVSGELLRAYAAIVGRASEPGNLAAIPADVAFLADQTVHPFLKAEALARSVLPTDAAELARVTAQLGGDPADLLRRMAGDAGMDPADLPGSVASMGTRAAGYAASGEELGARAAQLARRFETLGGAYSDEFSDTVDRVLDFDRAYRATQPKAKAQGINQMPMDPATGARRSATAVRTERTSAQAAVAKAEAKVAAAEAALRSPGTAQAAVDAAETTWVPVARPAVFASGRSAERLAAAQVRAAAWERETGRPVHIVRNPRNGSYAVYTETATAPAPVVRPAPDLLPQDRVEAVAALDDRYLTGRADALDLGYPLDELHLTDPAYAPEEMANVRTYLVARKGELERDIAATPWTAGTDDRRVILLGTIESRLSHLDRRASAAETAAVAPAAAPEAMQQAMDLRVANGGTPESGGAVAADGARTGGRIDLDAMRAEMEAAQASEDAPGPRYLASARGSEATSAFPDPSDPKAAPVPYRMVLAEADDLITSADRGFDVELQPRMRGLRTASDEQVMDIQTNLNPDLLLTTDSGAQGVPVVDASGQVIAGNGRVAGIRGANTQSSAAYRAAVDARAAELGLSTEGMRNPVLVREVGLPHAEAVRLAVQLNFETGMPLADQALGLSRLLTVEDIQKLKVGAGQTLDDAIASGVNDDFLRAFESHIPTQHRFSMKQTDGELTTQARDLIGATLLARFTNASRDPRAQLLIATLFEGDPEVQSLASGLDAIGSLLAAQVESVGKPWEKVPASFAADLIVSMQAVFTLRGQMGNLRDVEAALTAVQMFGAVDDLPSMTPTQQVLAANLARLAQPGAGGGATAFRRLLRNVGARIRGHEEAGVEANPEDLWAQAAATPIGDDPAYPAVVNEAMRLLNMKRAEGSQLEMLPEPDGTTIIRDASGAQTARLYPVVDDAPTVLATVAPVLTDVVLTGNDWATHATQAARSTGRLVIRVDTEAEAAAVRAYLDGTGPALPPEYRVVDGAIEPLGRKRKNPALASLRESLAGREHEVRFAGQVDEVVGEPSPAPEIVAHTQRDIDPDFERVTGLSPERPDADLAAREAAAGTAPRLVLSSDQVDERAAQRASGAPVARGRHVIQTNAPTDADRIRVAQEARDAAALELEGARARLDALAPEPELPPVANILEGHELDLYQRYLAQTGVDAGPLRQPRTVGDVLDTLASLDLGLPPLIGTMNEAEMETLRGALLRVLNARMDDLGAPPTTAPARRAGVGAMRPGVGTRVDAPPSVTTPDDLSADLAEVVRTLQNRVYEADHPLDGWEGTQYEIGRLPVKGRDGGPLAPRIPGGEDWINRLDDLVPGLGDELLHGRKRAWGEREADARLASWMGRMPGADVVRAMQKMADTALAGRPERLIVKQAIDRFTRDALKHFTGSPEEYDVALRQISTVIGAWHEGMKNAEIGRFQKYRRVGLVPADKLEAWAIEALKKGGAGEQLPSWYNLMAKEAREAGIKHPLAEAWRGADNRIRAYFAQQPGGMSKFLDTVYDSRLGRTGHELGRNLTVGYHIGRFLMDLRWLGLEAIEAPTLVLFREGPGAMWEGMGKGIHAGKSPLFVGEKMRDGWAWWLAQSDPGSLIRGRERFVLAMVRRSQEQEFPRVLRQAAMESPDLAAAIKAFDGGDPAAWLKRLDADWELATSRGRYIGPAEAERLFKPYLERGVISAKEYDEFVRAGRYTGHPALDAELSRIADPRLAPIIERLMVINEQGWNDAASLIFGQTSRSNVQRLANHPLLYWPVSYQIKATKWLAGLLLDRAFGIDTGAGGMVTLGMLHQQHKDRMANDPEYATAVVSNPTLLFAAQMLFPIAPWDLGVGLSPFTRLALDMATSEADEGYRRNVFSVGPGYTYFSLLPRLFYEQSKEGSWAQGAGPIGDVFQTGQRIFPYSVPVMPKSTSELYQAEQQVYGGGQLPPQYPFQNPETRFR